MRKYRVNPSCPYCREEHCYWTIKLTEEEQEQLDRYYEDNRHRRQRQTSIANLIDEIKEKPLRIQRTFVCGACEQEFEAFVTVLQSNEVGYSDPDTIAIGVVPM